MMRALVVAEQGSQLGIERGRLVVRKQGQRIASAPGMVVTSVTLLGRVGLTTPAMAFLAGRGVPITVLSSRGRVRARVEPPLSPHAEVRRRQVLRAEDPGARFLVARQLVRGKVENERTLLLRALREGRMAPAAHRALRAIDAVLGGIDRASDIDALRACEGRSSRALYAWAREWLEGCVEFRRRDRWAPDPFNVLLNFLAALLRSVVHGAAEAAGLDPFVGFLHRGRPGAPVLVLDLMEEWRPPLVVGTALALIDLRQVRPRDVSADGRLSAAALEATVERFYWRLERPAPLRGWAKDTTWHGAILEQARRFARWTVGRGPIYEAARAR
jgi:CRISPR-associated protein Cas1